MVEFDEAKRRIEPIEALLIDAHKAAVAKWATFVQESPELALPLDATARANFLHCHIRAEGDRRVADVADVESTDCLEFFALRIGTDILLRFKFVEHGQPSNVATIQQRNLARQLYTPEMTLALNGESALALPTLLTCGYTLDGASVGRIEIRRDCVGHPSWMYDIYGGDAVSQPLPFDGMVDTTKPATVKSTRKQEKGADQAQDA